MFFVFLYLCDFDFSSSSFCLIYKGNIIGAVEIKYFNEQ